MGVVVALVSENWNLKALDRPPGSCWFRSLKWGRVTEQAAPCEEEGPAGVSWGQRRWQLGGGPRHQLWPFRTSCVLELVLSASQ